MDLVCFLQYPDLIQISIQLDILIDQHLKPWLLEVNLSPALNVDSQTDIDVKQPLLEDILSLINIQQEDGIKANQYVQEQLQEGLKRKKKGSIPSTCKTFDLKYV